MNIQRKEQEESELSFQPHINGDVRRKKMTHDEAMEKIVMRNQQWKQKRDEKIKIQQDDLLMEELNKCTFSPSFVRKKNHLNDGTPEDKSLLKNGISVDKCHRKNGAKVDETLLESRIKKGKGKDNELEAAINSDMQKCDADGASSSLNTSDGFKNSMLLFGRCINDATNKTHPVLQKAVNNYIDADDESNTLIMYHRHQRDAVLEEEMTDMYVSDDLFS